MIYTENLQTFENSEFGKIRESEENNMLIPINYDGENPTVSGRKLHEALEIKTAYKDWFPRMCEYGFIEGKDFCSKLSESTGGRPSTDHELIIPMAKELCMLQRNDKGSYFRQYFIKVEEEWNSPDKVILRGYMFAKQKLEVLTAENLSLKREVEHKEDVIIGLVDEISLADKRQILNRVVRYNHANYRDRWAILYREFEEKYHISLSARMERFNEEHSPKVKNKLDYIDRVMNKIPELYELAAKLFENDINALKEEIYGLGKQSPEIA